MTAYLDFFNGIETQFKTAREISKRYEEYPVLSWRVLFTEILDQLQEYDGVETPDIEIDQEDESKKKANLKKSKQLEPVLNFALEGKDLVIEYANVNEVTFKYYIIDPEILFSRAPFLMQNTEDFAYSKPCKTENVQLNKDLKELRKPISEEFQNQNVVIELIGTGKQLFQTYFSSSLKLVVNENYGELKVTDKNDKAIQKAYIKTFAKYNDGSEKFFKDGYTDIRGKFEYAQLNSKDLDKVAKFSIFVLSDEQGSLTREVKPPANIKKQIEVQETEGFHKAQHWANYQKRTNAKMAMKSKGEFKMTEECD